jgi:hypothetical protein
VLPAPSPSRQCARARTPPNRQCSVFNSVRRRRSWRPSSDVVDPQPRKSKDTLTTDIRMPPTAFGYCSIGPTGVEVPACVLSAAL